MRVYETVGTAASTSTGSLVLEHGNTNGVSSITFLSPNSGGGGEYGYIQYHDHFTDGSYNSELGNGLLTIGIENEGGLGAFADRISLWPASGTGNVGINTKSPRCALDVSGSFNVSGNINSSGNINASGALSVYGNTSYSDFSNPSAILKGGLIINTTTGSSRLILGTYYTGGVGSTCAIQASDFYNNMDNTGGQYLYLNPYSNAAVYVNRYLMLQSDPSASYIRGKEYLYLGYNGINNVTINSAGLYVSGLINTNNIIRLTESTGSYYGELYINNASNQDLFLHNRGTGWTFIRTKNNDNAFVMNQDGYAAFNTTPSNSYRLDVNGNMRINGNVEAVSFRAYSDINGYYGISTISGHLTFTAGQNTTDALNNPHMKLSSGGNLSITGTITASSYNASSDYRIKENVVPLNASFTVDMLNPVTYNLKNSDKQEIGFIAHEVQEFFPFLVNGVKDGPETQSVNYNGFIGILTKEIQVLKRKDEENRAKIDAQESRLVAQESRIQRLEELIANLTKP